MINNFDHAAPVGHASYRGVVPIRYRYTIVRTTVTVGTDTTYRVHNEIERRDRKRSQVSRGFEVTGS